MKLRIRKFLKVLKLFFIFIFHFFGRIYKELFWKKESTLTFTFIVHVYNEKELLRSCLSALKKIHKTSKIIVISDGIADSEYPLICEQYQAKYILGENLKAIGRGSLFIKRLVSVFLENPADYLIKIDPDTALHRKFYSFIQADYLGSLKSPGTANEHIQGGCRIISKSLCEKIMQDEHLNDNYYNNPDSWAAPSLAAIVEDFRSKTGVENIDLMFQDIVRRHGVKSVNLPDINCEWKIRVPNFFNYYSVTHPCKSKKL